MTKPVIIPSKTNHKNLERYLHMRLSKAGGSASGAITETSYEDLKAARDNGELVPGALYRITDYVATTAQENTRSAGHQFDIIVQAISESTLSEDARAIQHNFEMPEKCYSSEDEDFAHYDGVVTIDNIEYTKYSLGEYSYLINARSPRFSMIQETSDSKYKYQFYQDYFWDFQTGTWENTIGDNDDSTNLVFDVDLREFSYFSNSNLAAWKLKYCLDNDADRFAWAQPYTAEGIELDIEPGIIFRLKEKDATGWFIFVSKEYNIANGTSAFIKLNKYPVVGDSVTITNSNGEALDTGNIVNIAPEIEEGKGVIYQMIDEHNNNCPYDFKNIQFLRSEAWQNDHTDWTDGAINSHYQDVYFYTFSSFLSSGSIEDVSVIPKTTNDSIGTVETANNNTILPYMDGAVLDGKLYLNDIILIVTDTYDSVFTLPMFNTFRHQCKEISLADEVVSNTFNSYIYDFCSYGIFRKNTIYQCSNYETGEDASYRIIYAVGGTIYVKSINDAFSET